MATGTQNKIYSNLNFRPLHTRDCVLYERGNVAPFSVIGGETGAASVIGPNSNPGGSPDVPSVIGVYSAMSEAAQPGNIRLIDSELLLNYAGSTAIEVNPTGIDGQPTSANQNTAANSIAAIRGGITVGGTYTSPAVTSSFPSKTTATTITAGFLYGVQGKLTLGAGATSLMGQTLMPLFLDNWIRLRQARQFLDYIFLLCTSIWGQLHPCLQGPMRMSM